MTQKELKVDNIIISGEKVDIKIGNITILSNKIEGKFVHNIELIPGKGGQFVGLAGSSVQVLGKDETGKFEIIKLSSGE